MSVPARPTAARGSTLLRPDEAGEPAGSDLAWVVTLFGTAVGAGILFLPLNAGAGGIWPLLIGTLLVFPMTFLGHRALSRFVTADPDPEKDITELSREHFGEGWGVAVTALYALCFVPILPIYGVAVTNAVDSLLANQLGWEGIPRWLLSLVLVSLLMSVVMASQRVMLWVAQVVVYPLIAMLAVATVVLVPDWSLRGAGQWPAWQDLLMDIWLMVPVLVFAFNHSAAVSTFSMAMEKAHGADAARRASRVLFQSAALLVLFTMGFVWSCVLALGPEGVSAAREANLPVLSYLANERDDWFFSVLGPLVTIAAIVSSYFGHYLGASEGLIGLTRALVDREQRVGDRPARIVAGIVLFLLTWGAAVVNPSILKTIETLSGPVMAMIIFLLPLAAVYSVPSLARYRGSWQNAFLLVIGLLAVAGMVYGLVG
ncbi:amino acid permease [Kytococcus sp. Marseille-QA3725]